MRKPRCAAMLGHHGCNDDTAHNDRIRHLDHNGARQAEKQATRNNQQATHRYGRGCAAHTHDYGAGAATGGSAQGFGRPASPPNRSRNPTRSPQGHLLYSDISTSGVRFSAASTASLTLRARPVSTVTQG
jgi:hypothetical protein